MRLVKAAINGFGRLAEGKINLDNKVIAIVGPNEAGKTTLLRALAFIDNRATLSASERSRHLNVPDDATVVSVQYLLDKEDQSSVVEFDLEDAPTSIWLSRTASSDPKPHLRVEPAPRKAIAPLEKSVKALRTAATKRTFAQLDYQAPGPDEEGNEVPVDEAHAALRNQAESTIATLFNDIELDGIVTATSRHAGPLRSIRDAVTKYGLTPPLADALSAILNWIDRDDPTAAVAQALYDRTPNILMFSEADRTLASTHTLSDELVATPPASLANLVGMAGLDLRALWATFTSGDEGERETLIDEANRVLAAKFKAAWKQSKITVVLKTERTVLSIRIKQDDKRITQFDERSAGLKMFVALVAFLAVREEITPPVLLIDEAETHLHIDAQADLVNTFMTQQQAAKVIYTTHSPACLPPDLGSNIRAVVPDSEHEYRSVIQGSFWHGAAGFSPLMLAMGAGAAAFSTARYVVLGEGASEMLLLPSLIKSAINVPDLEYQVAPGLSEVPPDMYPELDLAGARVAYVLDGDKGGRDRKSALVSGGVPSDRIVTLDALTLENLLDAESYLKGVRLLLAECNPDTVIPALPDLPEPTAEVWPTVLGRWADGHNLKMPGKRIVASRLVEDGLAVPSTYGTPVLRRLHDDLNAVLKRSASSRANDPSGAEA
ncbi:AAA family ATPase [Microbacterium alcoholitolerans]|uniref:AAA family ATPase n=1 Tax=unclassified Microbacterium TaxID=2609290 RepID=UPI003D186670